MNGTRLDDLGDWESLVLHVRYQSPELSMLPMWSPVLSLPASDHASLTHFTWDQDSSSHEQDHDIQLWDYLE